MKKIYAFIAILILAVSIAAIFFIAFPKYKKNRRESSIQSLKNRFLQSMSTEEKVGQLIHVGMPGIRYNATIDREIQKHCVGGVILFAYNLKTKTQIKKLTAELQKSAGKHCAKIPLFISADQEGGRVYRVPPKAAPHFPGAMTLGQMGKEELVREVGFITAYELLKLGINMVLAPVLDVNNNPANPVINTRSFGSAPALVSRMGRALARGIREANGVPVIKHFPGHGNTFLDSHLSLPRIERKLEQMQDSELAPFREAIHDGAEAIMTAHILYRHLDEKYPATLSSRILTDLLRNKMGFRGLIMTDAMEMHAIVKNFNKSQAAVRAINAGADVILLTGAGRYVKKVHKALLEAVKKNAISQKRLNEAVGRQIELKIRRGYLFRFNHPFVTRTTETRVAGVAPAKVIRHPGLKYLRAQYKQKSDDAEYQANQIRANYHGDYYNLQKKVSRLGIASLRQRFRGLEKKSLKNFRFFYRTSTMARAAKKAGLLQSALLPGGSWTALRNFKNCRNCLQRAKGETWIVELRASDLRAWKRLARLKPEVIGLYADNPFLDITVPSKGAVLASFSPTRESRIALVDRVLDGKPIKQADLILPEIKSARNN